MKRIFEILRSLLIWMWGTPVFAASCLVLWLASFFPRGPGFERLIKSVCRLILAVCGVRIQVEGRENCVPGRPYIVMMNHVNFFDPFVIYAGFPGWARGVEEESHFRWPIYGPTIRRIGTIPISRTDTSRAMSSLARAAELIRREKDFSIVVLPEGTRTRDGKLGRFKRGGFLLALETGLDILPIVQVGADRINHRGSRLIRPGKVRFLIMPAVSTAGITKENQSVLIERVRAVFLRQLGEEKRQPSKPKT